MDEDSRDAKGSDNEDEQIGNFKISADGEYLVGETESYRLADVMAVDVVSDDKNIACWIAVLIHFSAYLVFPIARFLGHNQVTEWMMFIIWHLIWIPDLLFKENNRVFIYVKEEWVEVSQYCSNIFDGFMAFFSLKGSTQAYERSMTVKAKLEALIASPATDPVRKVSESVGESLLLRITKLWKSNKFTEFRSSGWFIPAIVVGVILLGAMFFGGGNAEPQDTETRDGAALRVGETYYIWVSEITVYDVDRMKNDWDSNGTGPDLYYELYSGTNKVFSSDIREDTLVGLWTLYGIDYMSELRGMLSSGKGKSSLEEYVQAGLFRVSESGGVGLHVIDKDFMDTTFAGAWNIHFSMLHEGENSFTAEFIAPTFKMGDHGVEAKTVGNAVQSTIINVLPTDGMVDYLKQQLVEKR